MKYLRAFVFFLPKALLYLGLPLFGWGLDNLRGFFSLAPRTGYALTVVLFAAAVGVQAFFGTDCGSRVSSSRLQAWSFGSGLKRFWIMSGLPNRNFKPGTDW